MKSRPNFDPLFHRVIRQKGTNEAFELVRADLLHFKQRQINKIVEICNEPPIFHQIIIEKPVSVSFKYRDAQSLLRDARNGWKSKTHFIFFILEQTGIPSGALEIKSADLDRAEIGYWNSGKNPGVMTGALEMLCKSAAEAGFRRFFALTEADNAASIKVLKSNGFKLVESRRYSQRIIDEYETTLT